MANLQFPTSQSQKVSNLWNTDHGLLDEGNYFVSTNPTPLTTVAMTTSVVDDAATASSTHAQYSPLIYIYNSASATDPNGKTIYLKYIRLLQLTTGQAWTSCTSAHYTLRLDPTSRYTSGVTATVPVNMNSNSSNNSVAKVYVGANVVSLPTAAQRLVGRGQIQGSIPLPGDQWIFTFGDVSAPTNVLGASGIKNLTLPCGPVAIAPGWSFQVDVFGVALAAAPAFEFEIGHVERVAGL